ncbi:hypothetical protein RF11_13003 [Thelohanellus kitauei]|uniref:Uncharacterized protein n=1 Tax=Thelohanellus kitauei TaxID=669202 RepID=A0A0C2MBB0_THEKT|nr:hypothetical protein RF11_13003 [Thelohanellus kitauei]
MLDKDDEIEINACKISLRQNDKSDLKEYSIGYKFTFKKNTKYVFKRHKIDLIENKESFQYIKLRVFDMSLQFSCFNRTCVNYKQYDAKEVSLTANELLYPCQKDDSDLSETKTICSVYDVKIKPNVYLTSLFVIMSVGIGIIVLLTVCTTPVHQSKPVDGPVERDGIYFTS